MKRPLLSALYAAPPVVAAQPAPPGGGASLQPTALVAQSPTSAAARAHFEPMRPADLAAAGYMIEPMCEPDPGIDAMELHAIDRRLFEAQLASGNLAPASPPIVPVGANNQVICIEWEVDQRIQPARELLRQTPVIQPGHVGLEHPRSMFHTHLKTERNVLFSPVDPQHACPRPRVTRDGQRLQVQDAETQQRFQTVRGVAAAERSALEHHVELSREDR